MQITFEQLPETIGIIHQKIDRIAALLQQNKTLQEPDADELLSVQQAATFLKLSVATLYGFTHNATIPFCKKGKRLYFSKLDLTEWVKTGRNKTKEEIAFEADIFLTQQKKKWNHGK
jgi:excisionase family DNA binding protein